MQSAPPHRLSFGFRFGLATTVTAVACATQVPTESANRSVTDLVDSVCAKVAESSCPVGDGAADCATASMAQRSAADEHACGDEYAAMLECVDANPIECAGAGGEWDPAATGACTSERASFERCLPVRCPSDIASCRSGALSGGFSCTCSVSGPAPGRRFSVDSCENVASAGAENCADEGGFDGGTCNPAFCPPPEEGVQGCCITANGPCGGVVAGECVEWSEGSCTPRFCRTPSVGTACCVTPNGPCGADEGTGCVGPSTPDASVADATSP